MTVAMKIPNRVAVITGASAGLGRAMAHTFAGAGARVAIVARTPGPLEEVAATIRTETGMDVLPISADVSTPVGCERVIEATRAGLGPVEILMGRYGTAQEFANIACFLVSDEGSYITGTAINVDGGLSPVV